MELFTRIVRWLSVALGVFAAALTAVAVVIVCQMVFVRYVLNETTIWQTDFVTYSLVAATFLGSPYVLLTKGHVNVDVLPIYAGIAYTELCLAELAALRARNAPVPA